MNGKGSTRRPAAIDPETERQRWEATFRKVREDVLRQIRAATKDAPNPFEYIDQYLGPSSVHPINTQPLPSDCEVQGFESVDGGRISGGHAKTCRCIQCWYAWHESLPIQSEAEYDGYSQIPGHWPQDKGT